MLKNSKKLHYLNQKFTGLADFMCGMIYKMGAVCREPSLKLEFNCRKAVMKLPENGIKRLEGDHETIVGVVPINDQIEVMT